MSKLRATAFRGLKFYLVGAAGILVQLGALSFLAGRLRLDYIIATPLAVEIAVLHNFFWHERFTWSDRSCECRRHMFSRLLRFNLTTGALSIVGNIALMKLFVSRFGLHYMPANIMAIGICSLLNFLVSDQMVFRPLPGNEA